VLLKSVLLPFYDVIADGFIRNSAILNSCDIVDYNLRKLFFLLLVAIYFYQRSSSILIFKKNQTILPPVRNHNPIEDALPLRDQETLRTCACKPCRPSTFSTRTGRLEFILPGSNLYGYIGGWPSPSKKRIRETNVKREITEN
jgi:hypothetical protein